MAQLNIRIDDSTRDLFDSLARARGVTTSELLRDLIDKAVGRGDSEPSRGDITPVSMSAAERRRLALQHEILEILTAESEYDAAHHRQMIDILDSGYTAEYYRMFQHMHAEMTERECNLVYDILHMFRTIEASVKALTVEQRADLGEHWEYGLNFGGFDFNDSNEYRLAKYARFLIEDDQWTELAHYFDGKKDGGNSHAPMLASYQRMLNVWRPMWNEKIKTHRGPKACIFSVDELRQVLSAWNHPRD